MPSTGSAMRGDPPGGRKELDRSPVLELERIVVQLGLAGPYERDSVVVGIGAKPADPIAECR